MENDIRNKKELAEIEKLQAEVLKTQAEEKEIKQRTRQGIWSIEFVVKTIISAVVTSAIVITWLLGFLQPFLEKESQISKMDNKIMQQYNEYESQRLRKEKDSLMIQKEKIRKSIEGLQIKFEELSIAYQKQATLNNREKYARLKQKAEEKSDSLKRELK